MIDIIDVENTYNKVGIEISGKLFVFRKVSNLHVKKLGENDIHEFRFFTSHKVYNIWKNVPVSCIGKLVFMQG